MKKIGRAFLMLLLTMVAGLLLSGFRGEAQEMQETGIDWIYVSPDAGYGQTVVIKFSDIRPSSAVLTYRSGSGNVSQNAEEVKDTYAAFLIEGGRCSAETSLYRYPFREGLRLPLISRTSAERQVRIPLQWKTRRFVQAERYQGAGGRYSGKRWTDSEYASKSGSAGSLLRVRFRRYGGREYRHCSGIPGTEIRRRRYAYLEWSFVQRKRDRSENFSVYQAGAGKIQRSDGLSYPKFRCLPDAGRTG